MNDHAYEFAQLLAVHLRGELTQVQRSRFDELLAGSSAYRALLEKAVTPGVLDKRLQDAFSVDVGAAREQVVQRLFGQSAMQPVHRVHLLKRAWIRYAAAIIIITGLGTYLWNTQKEKPAIVSTSPRPALQPVVPGGNKAVLTLSNGKQIVLDETVSGDLTQDGGATITKKADGQVVYTRQSNAASAPVVMNTMRTPRGGQYQLTLPDGSRVWLNAASSITYPTSFSGKKRTVSITGEVYLEVAKKAAQPFVVTTRTDTIEVLGTHFNVNTYPEEGAVKTSLLEGKVKVGGQLLRPGQAFTNGHVVQTDTDQDVAWKNGLFNFNRLSMEQAMRQVARWYDVDIRYVNGIPQEEMLGKMDRNVQLEQLLNGLNGMGAQFKLENRTIVITR